ncbi:MAG: hypothetical protein KAR42_09680 [candidate division Zixibacteria bacterium]|nr:hypothetical protein [candidate division Zixibacteria bacterium]
MKKVIIVVVLALALAGVAYIQAIFSNQDTSPNLLDRKSISEEDILKDYIKKSDVTAILDSVRQHYIDSLYSTLRDSVTKLAEQKKTVPAKMTAKLDSLKQANSKLQKRISDANGEIKRVNQAKGVQAGKLAEKFYKNEIAGLPSDLTEYERAVSLKEIKSKAKAYFNISSKALKRITAKYK